MNLKNIAGLLFILVSMTWGCSQNAPAETEKSTTKENVKQDAEQALEKVVVPPVNVNATIDANATSGPDTYGRLPGDEHYGHSHAPQNEGQGSPANTPQFSPATGAPTIPATGPDAYGRSPGHEHYGHDHE
jgi:hypothetical protein